ncbi:hypothetical protein KAR02_10300, partial [Candidatus Bipolaricaulota bacterium]|nr:hypothetical protein [Candidatus Bipolaricaulota bacterium]
MARLLISNGRVTSRDPSLHLEGEISEAQDCYYAPADPAPRSILGRSAFNAAAEPPLESGVFLEFDAATGLMVVLGRGAATLRKATAGLTGSFTDLAGWDASDYTLAGTADLMDSAHYRDQHILVNGVDRPRVVRADGTQMFLGMLQATDAPNLDSLNGAGAGFVLNSGKDIIYWIEERVKENGVIVKRSSTAASARVTLTGTGATVKPRITRTAFKNPDTTDWAVFATATDGTYPIGAQIGEAVAATDFIDDLRTGTPDPLLPSGDAFEIVSLTVVGITKNIAKWGPPPIGSTLDIFEDAVFMNDIAKPSETAFAFTDNIHAWPEDFRVKFSTKHHDIVRAIVSMEDFSLVLLQNGVWRVNTLPKTTDQAFETERAKSEVEGAFGIVNAKAWAKFSFGEGTRLGYISPHGAVVTDGSRWSTISDDMAWEGDAVSNPTGVEITQTSKIRMLNNPRFFRMEMGYVPVGVTRSLKQAFLHYHPSHAKSSEEGGLRAKMTWPINRDGNDLFLGKLNGVDTVFSTNEDGRVYLHDTGVTEPVASGGIKLRVRTSDTYPADIGVAATLRGLWVHHQAAAGVVGKVGVISRSSGEPDSFGAANIPLDYREATPSGRQGDAEAYQFEIEVENPAVQVAIDYFAAD